MHRDYLYWIWLSLCFGPGSGGFTEVLESFGGPYEAYAASEKELVARLGADSSLVRRLMIKDLSQARRIYEYCVTWGVSILTYGDIAYPARLRTIQNPPLLLYYVGELPALNRRLCVGVVGTRKMSEYGKRMAYKISYELASAGAVVVSGMALGCDGVAAAGAIAANGTTVAVLGCGIDLVYPRQHTTLMEHIKANGAVMTEYPPGTAPLGRNFPVRNRIISGLSQGSLAIEGDSRSGAMLTIAHAVKQGRKIFAVPGNVGEASAAGTNELIRNGATVVLDAGDVLESFEVTDKELIDFESYLRARSHSELNDAVLLRLGVYTKVTEPVYETLRDPGTGAIEKIERKTAPEKRPTSVKKASPKRTEAEEKAPKEQTPPPKNEYVVEKSTPMTGDGSPEILAALSDRERKIFTEMPIDRAISIDRLSTLGFSIGDIMTAMTILEIRGLVTSLPGGLYLKK